MINIYNQDCLIAMRQMRDNEFDLAIVDPPYGLTKGMKQGIKSIVSTKKDKSIYAVDDWNIKPIDEYFIELQRVSKNQVIFGGNYFPILWTEPTRSMIVWDKRTIGKLHADYEMAWCSMDRNAKLFSYRWSAIQKETGQHQPGDKIHPTEKPRALYDWILRNYAQSGDTILDTHLGGGSIAHACHDTGHDLTAYEINETYFSRALFRLKQYQRQLSLFEDTI